MNDTQSGDDPWGILRKVEALDRRVAAIGSLVTAIAGVGLGVLAGVGAWLRWDFSWTWVSMIGVAVAVAFWVAIGVWTESAWTTPDKK